MYACGLWAGEAQDGEDQAGLGNQEGDEPHDEGGFQFGQVGFGGELTGIDGGGSFGFGFGRALLDQQAVEGHVDRDGHWG